LHKAIALQRENESHRTADKLLLKAAWYDSQPHPNDQDIASTFPHHKHVPPDIRNHRIPAPNMRFDQPNVEVLIQEIEALLKET